MILNDLNKSIHDNEILKIAIDIKSSFISILTNYKNENTELFFEDVLYHYFENIIHQNVIFDIKELNISEFINNKKQYFLQKKNYFIPPIDWKDIDDLKTKLMDKEYFGYEIYSSIGMTGWVISKKLTIK